MTSGLATFQQAFAAALFAPQDAGNAEVLQLVAQPAFAVYRNTVMKACVDALEANFPAVARLVGSEWFRAAAALHAAADPPRDGRLLHYGAGFPAFLESFEPAAELGYLPGVARLDALWREAHAARDAEALDPAHLAHALPDALAMQVLHPHPAARWRWFAEQPIYSIWSRNRRAPHDGDETDRIGGREDLVWQAEGALLTRPCDVVNWRTASRADCTFLDACAAGAPLAEAAEAALQADPNTDLAALLQHLLLAGAFTDIQPSFTPDPS
jgi:Putative DNA-binding domain